MLTRAAKRAKQAGCGGGGCACSFAVSGEAFLEQRFYECVTCEMTLDKGVGFCNGCKRTCHAGHDVGFVGRIKAYCDCGKRGCALSKAGAAGADGGGSDSEEDAEELDPRLSRNYGDKGYWDDRYTANPAGEGDEWLVGFAELKSVVLPHLERARAAAAGDEAQPRRPAHAIVGRLVAAA